MSKEFTYEEVKNNSNPSENLIILANEVYDVTPFLNEHPGGEEVLIDQKNKNATEVFEDVGHSTEARELMKKYKVGIITDVENIPDNQPTHTSSSSYNKQDDSKSKSNSLDEESGFPSWLVPAIFGIAVVVIYQYLF